MEEAPLRRLSAGGLHFQQAGPIAGQGLQDIHHAGTGGCPDERPDAEVIHALGEDRVAVLGSEAISTRERESQVVDDRNCIASGSTAKGYKINLGPTP